MEKNEMKKNPSRKLKLKLRPAERSAASQYLNFFKRIEEAHAHAGSQLLVITTYIGGILGRLAFPCEKCLSGAGAFSAVVLAMEGISDGV